MEFDAFISHATEDKETFVRDLAKRLEEHRILIWYDEFTLVPGSGLRRSIDFGLSKSRYGIVVLSDNFFKKSWTNWELDGLVARQNALENGMILPIWLNITKDNLLKFSPSLADKVAINASIGLDKVVTQLLKVIKPEGSTLVIAREILFKAGLKPPLITDDWWLDVLEYCGNSFPHHDYLDFGIPWKGFEPKNRGEFVALNAMQKLWQEEGDEINISQLTHPSEIIAFIKSQPGLEAACKMRPEKAALFFPQLVINDFGKFLEPYFENLLNTATHWHQDRYLCREEVALRHSQFGNYASTKLADFYFAGAGGGIGPSTRRYEHFEWIVWLLSSQSDWLPVKIKNTLLEGLKQWAVWPWHKQINGDEEFKGNSSTGSLIHALYGIRNINKFKLTKDIQRDIKSRIEYSISKLNLPETADILFDKFISERVIEVFINQKTERGKRQKNSKL